VEKKRRKNAASAVSLDFMIVPLERRIISFEGSARNDGREIRGGRVSCRPFGAYISFARFPRAIFDASRLEGLREALDWDAAGREE
jgi:hypothetical protein